MNRNNINDMRKTGGIAVSSMSSSSYQNRSTTSTSNSTTTFHNDGPSTSRSIFAMNSSQRSATTSSSLTPPPRSESYGRKDRTTMMRGATGPSGVATTTTRSSRERREERSPFPYDANNSSTVRKNEATANRSGVATNAVTRRENKGCVKNNGNGTNMNGGNVNVPRTQPMKMTRNGQETRRVQKAHEVQKGQNYESKHVEGDDEDEESLPKRSFNMQNFSEDDENAEMRPNKLFPVKNERDVLLRKVRSVLNKVSSVNYHRLRKRWLNLMPSGDDEENEGPRLGMDQVGEVLQLVIAKALDDTIYMHIYAGLMGYVVTRKSPEMSARIRQLVNSQLHHELSKLTTDKELALFARCTQRVDATRRKKVTLHRFIAELYGEKACTSKFLYERVRDLMIASNPSDVDENVECLCILMTFAGQKLEEVKKNWVEEIFEKLVTRQNETPQMISKRIQFMILDLVEMRGNGWSPHNKWWSPSVQITPHDRQNSQTRERTQSERQAHRPSVEQTIRPPSPVVSLPVTESPSISNGVSRRNEEPPPKKLQRKNIMSNSLSSRSRTRSESCMSMTSGGSASAGSSPPNSGAPLLMMSDEMQLQNLRMNYHPNNLDKRSKTGKSKSELTPNQSRALMALLNKVSPYNIERISQQLYEVLNADTMEEAVNFIVDKILDDSFYTRTHAGLIHKVSLKTNMRGFGEKIGIRAMQILKKTPESKDGFQFLAELYNLRLVSMDQVKTALEGLTHCCTEMISSAVESFVMFLFIAGAKLDADVNDEIWMDRLIEFWEKKANLVAHNQGRPVCLMRDVIELRQNKWAQLKTPHWIPPTIDLPTIRFEPESLIRLFQSDRMEFLRFVKGETSTLNRIEKFSQEALQYAVRHGNAERDPEFLRMTGECLRVLLNERLLHQGRWEGYIGTYVPEVIMMKRSNAKAWENLGLIMSLVY